MKKLGELMKKYRTTVLLVILLIISSLIFLYPNFSDYWNSLHQTRVIADYEESMSNIEEEDYTAIFEEAEKYNEELNRSNKQKFENGEPVDEHYTSLLNLNDNHMMGYITIDKIDVDLPIYHGTAEPILAVGTGHLEGSSLPIGGEGTHTVITGHRGLPTATLFTHLDQVEKGDIFTLSILSETLTYQVDQILIVKPEEVDDIKIVKGEDYCTLITCTPFGINTDRILVRGTRIENIEDDMVRTTSEAVRIDPLIVVPFIAVPVVLLLLLLVFITPASKEEEDDIDLE